LYHFERTTPDDHWDELGIWRLIELKRSLHKLDENDPDLKIWDERLSELASGIDEVDTMLMELEPRDGADTAPAAETARGQLELFGSLLSSLAEAKWDPEHQIIVSDGAEFGGSWEEIVRRMRDEKGHPAHSMQEFMSATSQHAFRQTGIHPHPRRGKLHPRQRRSGAPPDRSVTAPAQWGARAALDAARPAVARLDVTRGTEDLAADLIEVWMAVQAALRSLVGSNVLSGQSLIREARQRQLISFDQANSLAEFEAVHARVQNTSYRPTAGDVTAARDAFLKLDAALMGDSGVAPPRPGPMSAAPVAAPVDGTTSTEPAALTAPVARRRIPLWASIVAGVIVLAVIIVAAVLIVRARTPGP